VKRKMIAPMVLGVVGIGILISLGMWQTRRLVWKNAILAEITAQISRAPISLKTALADGNRPVKYRSVAVTGKLTGQDIHVLASRNGAGFRMIAALETSSGAILVDLGFRADGRKARVPANQTISVVGNIMWPRETDSFTPAPDRNRNIWFARDLPLMAEELKTRPVLIVARKVSPPIAGISPWPVDTLSIPNNHLNYAITWFSLALVWLGMTGLWLWRIRQKID